MGIGIVLPQKKQKWDKILSSDWNTFIDNFALIDNFIQQNIKVQIQLGKVENIDTSTKGLKYGTIYFEKPFNNVPIILLSLNELDQRVTTQDLTSTNVTTTSFVWQFKVTATSKNTYCNLFWLAIAKL